MEFFETFSQRQARAARAGEPEIYSYDKFPDALATQITMIWRDAMDVNAFLLGGKYYGPTDFWNGVEKRFMRAIGLPYLLRGSEWHSHTALQRFEHYFLTVAKTDHRLDMVEIVFMLLAMTDIESVKHHTDELNFRFKQSGVGYQFVEKTLIRLDSTIAHEDMVKPALILLGREGYEKADAQYRAANEAYRRDEFSQAITEAGRAFESALKAICAQKGWDFAAGDRVSELVAVVVREGLFPPWLEKGITAYVAMLKTGLPATRNNAGAHGSAPDDAAVAGYLARYALHMSAANILMVVEAAEGGQH